MTAFSVSWFQLFLSVFLIRRLSRAVIPEFCLVSITYDCASYGSRSRLSDEVSCLFLLGALHHVSRFGHASAPRGHDEHAFANDGARLSAVLTASCGHESEYHVAVAAGGAQLETMASVVGITGFG